MTDTLYSRYHTWVRFLPDGGAQVGVTQYLVDTQKKPVFINLCDEGDAVRAGEWLGDVEFFKGVTDILSPVSGTVARVNEALLRQPEGLLDAEHAWLVTLTDAARDGTLWTKEQYTQYFTRGAR